MVDNAVINDNVDKDDNDVDDNAYGDLCTLSGYSWGDAVPVCTGGNGER